MAGMDYYASADQPNALDEVADVAERIPQIRKWLDRSKKPERNKRTDGVRMSVYTTVDIGLHQIKVRKASPGWCLIFH